MQLATQAAISQAFKTPEASFLFLPFPARAAYVAASPRSAPPAAGDQDVCAQAACRSPRATGAAAARQEAGQDHQGAGAAAGVGGPHRSQAARRHGASCTGILPPRFALGLPFDRCAPAEHHRAPPPQLSEDESQFVQKHMTQTMANFEEVKNDDQIKSFPGAATKS